MSEDRREKELEFEILLAVRQANAAHSITINASDTRAIARMFLDKTIPRGHIDFGMRQTSSGEWVPIIKGLTERGERKFKLLVQEINTD